MPRRHAILALTLALGACTLPTATTKPAAQLPAAGSHVILDFESPNPAVTWVPSGPAPLIAPDNEPASQPSPLQRTSQRPQAGLWSLGTQLSNAGEIRFTPAQPLDLSLLDLLIIQITHTDTPAHNGHATAALILTDADGKTIRGDAFPILSNWQPIAFDLHIALDQGLDISRITAVGLALSPTRELTADVPLAIQTDTWTTQI